MTPAELAILKAEITNDPLGRYAGMDDVAIAKSLNAPDRNVDNETFAGGELGACIDLAEWSAAAPTMTQATRDYLSALIAADSIPNTQNVRQTLKGIFPDVPGKSRSRIVDLLRRKGSRAEELGLRHVTESDVADAKRR